MPISPLIALFGQSPPTIRKTRRPSIGRMVVVHGVHGNGVLEHPAVITRVWNDVDTSGKPAMVNLTVFPDCGAPVCKGSVLLHYDRAEAFRYRTDLSTDVVAFWPDLV